MGEQVRMEERRIEVLLEATQPVAHHSETIGNSAVLMRERVRQPDGSFEAVPIITGDTMRHGMREAAAYAMLDAAGLMGEPLTEGALRLLFAGGLMSKSSASVKLDETRELFELIPPLGLLGGCAQNRIIPGRMQVEEALLVCEESVHCTPGWILEECGRISSCRAHVEDVQRVRMDPALDPAKRKLLASAAATAIEQKLLASESAAETGDAVLADRSKSTLMPRSFERLVRGSLFSWGVTVTLMEDPDRPGSLELERDCFMSMLAAFAASMTVGGKRGTGHGRLRAVKAQNVELLSWSERAETMALDTKRVGERFRSHVKERAGRIREFLGRVEA